MDRGSARSDSRSLARDRWPRGTSFGPGIESRGEPAELCPVYRYGRTNRNDAEGRVELCPVYRYERPYLMAGMATLARTLEVCPVNRHGRLSIPGRAGRGPAPKYVRLIVRGRIAPD